MRERLRDLPDMDSTYPTLHDHRIYGAGHDIRVRQTIALGQWAYHGGIVADLSAGVGAVARGITPAPILGDYAPGHPIQGPLHVTLNDLPNVDLYVCTETLEHLDGPDMVLTMIRAKAQRLLVSLPETRDGTPDTNGEHIWWFDREGGERMLTETGWTIDAHVQVDPPDGPYKYLLWACS